MVNSGLFRDPSYTHLGLSPILTWQYTPSYALPAKSAQTIHTPLCHYTLVCPRNSNYAAGCWLRGNVKLIEGCLIFSSFYEVQQDKGCFPTEDLCLHFSICSIVLQHLRRSIVWQGVKMFYQTNVRGTGDLIFKNVKLSMGQLSTSSSGQITTDTQTGSSQVLSSKSQQITNHLVNKHNTGFHVFSSLGPEPLFTVYGSK